MAENPILSSNCPCELQAVSLREWTCSSLPKAGHDFFNPNHRHLSEIKVLLTWEVALAPPWDGSKGQVNHWLDQPLQEPLHGLAGLLCRLTLRANSTQVLKGQKAVFPTCSDKAMMYGEKQTILVQARRERSWYGSGEGAKDLGAPRMIWVWNPGSVNPDHEQVT